MSTPVEAVGAEGVKALVGQHLGYTDWMEITQERVNLFAEATGDHQWIHIDPERAAKESPFGGPIAHGFLTLSLIPKMLPEIFVQKGFSMGVNYGLEKVRFPSPVPVGSKLRAGAQLDEVTDIAGGIQLQLTITLEVEGAAKPSCVAVVLFRSYV
jgi:acyl dehydratase